MSSDEAKAEKKTGKGFAGLSTLVSDVEAPKESRSPAAGSPATKDTAQAAAKVDVQPRPPPARDPRPSQFKGVGWALGILVVGGALWHGPTAKQTARSPAPAANATYPAPKEAARLPAANLQTPFNEAAAPMPLRKPEIRAGPLVPQAPLPRTGEVQTFTYAEAVAPLELKSRGASHYVVKLSDATTGRPVMTVFVRGGGTVTVEVPLGVYQVKYASGDHWYGYEKLFGPETVYSKADKVFSFQVVGQQISGYSITLYTVASGNLRTRPISAAQF